MVAFGTTAPVGSVTVPRICPASCPCATEPSANIARSAIPKNKVVLCRRRLPANRTDVRAATKRDIRRILSPDAELIEGRQREWFAGGVLQFFEAASSIRNTQSCGQSQNIAGENMMSIIFNTLKNEPAMVKQFRDTRKYDFL